MKILIAEDDRISRRLLEASLIKQGYEVVIATNGLDAWEILRGLDAPRLAILDWMMPGMDGVQICRQVRARVQEQYTYIILLTAKNRKQDLIEGFDAGADDYITKPFDGQELKARLHSAERILDLQERLFAAQESLMMQATHDLLTKLPNRLLFSERLVHKLYEAHRYRQVLAVMFLDLDHFKEINDTYGHDIGDALLGDVAMRLTKTLREVDTIARMGGDEFTLIFTGVESIHDMAVISRRILDELTKPFELSSHEVQISASIGCALYPMDGTDADSLLKFADTAMYRAKEKGRNCYQFYSGNEEAEAA